MCDQEIFYLRSASPAKRDKTKYNVIVNAKLLAKKIIKLYLFDNGLLFSF